MSSRSLSVSQFVSTAEAATIIGCTDGRVRQMVRAGDITGVVRMSPRVVLIPRKQAEKIRDNPPLRSIRRHSA